MTDRESSSEIEVQAVRWIWRLDREGRAPELLTALEEWLAADTRRRGAFLQAEATWTMLDGAYRLPGETLEDRYPHWTGRKHGLSRRGVIAGGAAVAAGAAGVALISSADKWYGTGIGEVRMQPLPDGSTVSINTQSEVGINLGATARVVTLEKGEAWFRVAKDAGRPFVVKAGPVNVRAVGTAFSVRRRQTGADVLVTEGVVETWVEGSPAATTRMSAGTQAFVANNAPISTKEVVNNEIESALAWRSGKIDLSGKTLAEASAEFNRYNTRKLLVANTELAQQRVHGIFRTDDPLGFARAVRESLGAQIDDQPESIRIGQSPM